MRFAPISKWLAVLAGILAAPPAAHADVAVAGEVDLLEVHLGNGADHLVLDSTLTASAGPNRFVVKITGGSDTRTAFDEGQILTLYSRDLSESVAILGGVRHDLRTGRGLTHGSLGIEAELTPWLEGEHYVFVSENGNLTGSGQLLGRWKIAPALTIEPRMGFGWSGQRIPDEAQASGLTDLELSVRLRHPLGENLDVYVGAIHERLLGGTRRIAAASGDPANVTRAVIGAGLSF